MSLTVYVWNIQMIDKYHMGSMGVEIELKGRLSKGEEYDWMNTAGTGVVPKWVSQIGLLAIPLFLIGIVVLVISFFV